MGWAWTDERVACLKKTWAAGGSASICRDKLRERIGASMEGPTRNAVIGKVHRLGLSKHKPSTRLNTTGTKEHIRVKQERSDRVKKKTKQAHIVEALLKDNVFVPPTTAERHTCSTLPLDLCRWIYGDPRGEKGAAYCASKRLVDKTGRRYPYCAHHCCEAYPEMKRALENRDGEARAHAHG